MLPFLANLHCSKGIITVFQKFMGAKVEPLPPFFFQYLDGGDHRECSKKKNKKNSIEMKFHPP